VRLFKANASKVDCVLKQAEIENQNLSEKIQALKSQNDALEAKNKLMEKKN